MITESKVIELFYIANDFCKFFDAMMANIHWMEDTFTRAIEVITIYQTKEFHLVISLTSE